MWASILYHFCLKYLLPSLCINFSQLSVYQIQRWDSDGQMQLDIKNKQINKSPVFFRGVKALILNCIENDESKYGLPSAYDLFLLVCAQ